MNKVENLKKIGLSIQAGTSPDTMELAPTHPEIEFIFGLGPEGMTPFEFKLVGKAKGESVLLHLKKENFHSFFELTSLGNSILSGCGVNYQNNFVRRAG